MEDPLEGGRDEKPMELEGRAEDNDDAVEFLLIVDAEETLGEELVVDPEGEGIAVTTGL